MICVSDSTVYVNFLELSYFSDHEPPCEFLFYFYLQSIINLSLLFLMFSIKITIIYIQCFICTFLLLLNCSHHLTPPVVDITVIICIVFMYIAYFIYLMSIALSCLLHYFYLFFIKYEFIGQLNCFDNPFSKFIHLKTSLTSLLFSVFLVFFLTFQSDSLNLLQSYQIPALCKHKKMTCFQNNSTPKPCCHSPLRILQFTSYNSLTLSLDLTYPEFSHYYQYILFYSNVLPLK